MLKAAAGDHFIFGLSALNLERLKEGKPITIDLAPMGGRGHVVIFYGETEIKMAEMLQDMIGPDTKVSVDKALLKG